MLRPGRWLRDAADWLPDGAVGARGAAARKGGTPARRRAGRHLPALGERPVVRAGYVRIARGVRGVPARALFVGDQELELDGRGIGR